MAARLSSYKEGRGGTVAVLEQSAGSKRFRRLYIQGVSNTGDTLPSLRYMRLQALLPLIIHNGEPKSALVIGLGTGITSGALLRYPGLDQRVVAELLPEVLQATTNFQGNFGAGQRSAARHPPARWPARVAEPSTRPTISSRSSRRRLPPPAW